MGKDVFVDPSATHLYRRWWHRFIFWRRVSYPRFVGKRRFVSVEELRKEYSKEEQDG